MGVDCDFRRNISNSAISRYQTRYAQVGPSARARARRPAREPPESEFRELTEMLSTITAALGLAAQGIRTTVVQYRPWGGAGIF